MAKRKINILKKVLAEVCACLKGSEKFINARIEEICAQEEISVEEVIYFLFHFSCF